MNLSSVLKKQVPSKVWKRFVTLSDYCHSLRLHPYLVGGVVRDLLLNLPLKQDWDVTVTGGDLSPLVKKLCKDWGEQPLSHSTFKTYTFKFKDGNSLDLVTARQETYSKAGSLPRVHFGTLETDMLRRDFSVNALTCSLSQNNWGTLFDLTKGTEDLKKKQIRILHSRSFIDDPTRIFRALRFSGRFGFRLERKTSVLLTEALESGALETVSKDRIRQEIEKVFLEYDPVPVLKLLQRKK